MWYFSLKAIRGQQAPDIQSITTAATTAFTITSTTTATINNENNNNYLLTRATDGNLCYIKDSKQK